MLAISVDNLEEASEVVQMLGIPFPILYDPSTEAPQSYKVFNLLGDGLATPSTFVLDKEGVITWKYIARSIGDRPSVSTILAQLSGLEPTVTLTPTDVAPAVSSVPADTPPIADPVPTDTPPVASPVPVDPPAVATARFLQNLLPLPPQSPLNHLRQPPLYPRKFRYRSERALESWPPRSRCRPSQSRTCPWSPIEATRTS